MEKNQYFFQVRKVTNKLVTIDKDILTKQITGLFLQNSIRFYDKVLEYRTPILDKDLREKVRKIYSHRLDFKVLNDKLKLSAPSTNPFFKTYKIGNKVIYVNNDKFFDIVEYDNLESYLESLEIEKEKAKEIRTKKALILTSDVSANIVHLRSRNNN